MPNALITKLRQVVLKSIHYFFPLECYLCRAESQIRICNSCKRSLEKISWSGNKIEHSYWLTPKLRDAISQVKYQSQPKLLADLCDDITNLAYSQHTIWIPVPLTLSRYRERGFNQSLLLCEILFNKFGGIVDSTSLQRKTFRGTQTKLGKKQRETNLKNAFVWAPTEKIDLANVVIVDDVYTTGATYKSILDAMADDGRVGFWSLAKTLSEKDLCDFEIEEKENIFC